MAENLYKLDDRKHVFIDWDIIEPGYGVSMAGVRPESWELPGGVRLAVHEPRIDPEPLVLPDKPWESRINSWYSTLLEDEGRYRLYYDCTYFGEGDKPVRDVEGDVFSNPHANMLAYAESTDGVTWSKPNVGTVDFNGSTDNNLVCALNVALDRPTHGTTVFKDPSAPPDERYKLVFAGRYRNKRCVFGAVSPDGLRWHMIEEPVLDDYVSDTQTVVRFDPQKGRYVGYFRGWTTHESKRFHGRRLIAYAETDRFERWPRPEPIVAPDIHDGPSTDIYTNAYTSWPGADAHLMFPALYRRDWDVMEVHMMTSRDGVHWQRPSRQPVISSGEPGTDSVGSINAGCGIAGFRSGESSLIVGGRSYTHNQINYAAGEREPGAASAGRPIPWPESIYLATWRQDGFTSLEAESEGGFTTVPLTFAGSRLEVNAWARFGGEIRVEVAEQSGETYQRSSETVAGRTFEECDPISGDLLKHSVTWRGESDLSAWAGKPVRLRFRMRRARLHAIQIV